MIKGLFAGIALAALAGCQPGDAGDRPDPLEPGVLYTPVPVAGQTASPEERAACEAVGGRIRPAGLLGYEHCIQRFSDAGMTCSDDADCIGRCMNEGDFVEAGMPLVGRCEADDDPFGCQQEVIEGLAEPAICVD